MLQISPWSRVLTYLILVLGFIIALPNALPNSVLTRLPHWLPTNTVALGLDLQGGSYLLLEVELDQVQKDRLEFLIGDIRARSAQSAHRLSATCRSWATPFRSRSWIRSSSTQAKTLIAALNPSRRRLGASRSAPRATT